MHPLIEICAKVCVLMADEHTAASADCRANGNNAGALTRARQAQTANDCAIAIRALPRSEIDGAGGAVTLPQEAIELLSGGGIDNLSQFDRQRATAEAYQKYKRLVQIVVAPAALPDGGREQT